jgi:competence protein ComEC
MIFIPGNFIIITLIIIAIACLLISLFYNKQLTNKTFGTAIFFALFAIGLILNKNEKEGITKLEPEETTFVSTLSDYPVEKENTFMLTVDLNNIISGGEYKRVNGSILLYQRKDSVVKTFLPGDILLVKCTPLEIVNRGNPDEFDYKSFMKSKGICYYAFTGKKNILNHFVPERRKLKHSALIVRERIIEMFRERGIKGDRLALVSAITLGQKNMLDPEQKQIFINAGIMHIMAVSGLHAVILSLFIFKLLFFMKGKYNILRIIITITILWAFAFVTGLSPSVLRATLMFSFLQAGNLMNRKVNGINSVLASAFILIILKPSVITDAGFLLSYAAVIYIIGYYQDLYLKLQFKRWLPDKIWESVVVTLVAQAGTLPLTIMLFNRFPVYFILTNVIIVPLSSLLIIIGCLVPLTYPIVPVSEFLATILDKLTGLTEYLTQTAASLPYATIDRIGITTIECILMTIALSLLITFLIKNQPFSIKYPIVGFILLGLVGIIKNIDNGGTNELIVYNTPSSPTIGIRTGRTLHIFNNDDSIPKEVIRHIATRNLITEAEIYASNRGFYKAGNTNILITDSLKADWLIDINFNIMVLTGNKPWIERNIPSQYLPQTIIVSSEAPTGFRLPFSPVQISDRTISYVRKSGAYICRL